MPPASSARAEARRTLGQGAIFPITQAVAMLPWPDAFARAWLREQGLVSTAIVGGVTHECVVWSAVLEKLWPGQETVRRVASAPPPGATLDRVPTRARR